MYKILRVHLALLMLLMLCVPFIQAHSTPVFQIDQQIDASYQATDQPFIDRQSNWNAVTMLVGFLFCLFIKQLMLTVPIRNIKRFVYSFIPLLKQADHLLPVKCKSFYMAELLFISRM
ncbi:hypothetical protein ACQCN2_19735 [Brevibacillus ginsengisoli]|uniref:hypothetical protein n=1 Tax=Brevibacillus ginsengisoli TaxID=363854 RepID=UPI003CEF1A12